MADKNNMKQFMVARILLQVEVAGNFTHTYIHTEIKYIYIYTCYSD